MKNNSITPPHFDDELDLRLIIKALIEAKKIIILSVLFFVTATSLYLFIQKPVYKSSALIEIGYFELSDGRNELLETSSSLISNLKVHFEYKEPKSESNQVVSMKSIEDRLIYLETSSNSTETNKKILNRYLSFIDERHNRLFELKLNNSIFDITRQININESQIGYIQTKLSPKNQSKYNRIIEELSMIDTKASLDQSLNLLTENSLASDKLFNLQQDQIILKEQLNSLKIRTKTQTVAINGLETYHEKPKIILNLFIGLAIGLITGMFLVLIYNSIKSYRGDKN